jgi:hypothetical protein
MVEKNEASAQASGAGVAIPMKAFGIQAVRIAKMR